MKYLFFASFLFMLSSCGKYKIAQGNTVDSGANIPTNSTNGAGFTVAGGNGDSTAANQLNSPFGIFVDKTGNIYVADTYNNRIQKFSSDTSNHNATTLIGGNGNGVNMNQLNLPYGIFVDALGNIYIADTYNNRIQKLFVGTNKIVTVAGNSNGISGQDSAHLSLPTGVFVDKNGAIFIADQINNRIQKWPADTTIHFGITVVGGVNSQLLLHPVAVFVDTFSNIFISDYNNNRIQKWSSDTSIHVPIQILGSNSSGYGSNQLYQPWGLFVDVSDNIYVSDRFNNRIQKFTNGVDSATTVAGGNGVGGSLQQFFAPSGIYVDGFGNIFVADTYNNRIQKWLK